MVITFLGVNISEAPGLMVVKPMRYDSRSRSTKQQIITLSPIHSLGCTSKTLIFKRFMTVLSSFLIHDLSPGL